MAVLRGKTSTREEASATELKRNRNDYEARMERPVLSKYNNDSPGALSMNPVLSVPIVLVCLRKAG